MVSAFLNLKYLHIFINDIFFNTNQQSVSMFSNFSLFHDFKLVNFFDFVIFIEQLLRIVVFQMFDKIPIVYSTHSLKKTAQTFI